MQPPGSDVRVSLVVIHTTDVMETVAFFECLGLDFQSKRHGEGEHHVAILGDLIFEVHPGNITQNLRLGLEVPSVDVALESLKQCNVGRIREVVTETASGPKITVRTPDGLKIDLTEA